jgi:hypothetical protein
MHAWFTEPSGTTKPGSSAKNRVLIPGTASSMALEPPLRYIAKRVGETGEPWGTRFNAVGNPQAAIEDT